MTSRRRFAGGHPYWAPRFRVGLEACGACAACLLLGFDRCVMPTVRVLPARREEEA